MVLSAFSILKSAKLLQIRDNLYHITKNWLLRAARTKSAHEFRAPQIDAPVELFSEWVIGRALGLYVLPSLVSGPIAPPK
jgi:hypothetical protein